MKKTILISVLTTLATNWVLNSWFLIGLVGVSIWLYLGYLARYVVSEDYDHDTCILLGPIVLAEVLFIFRREGLTRLYKHFAVDKAVN